MKFYLGKQAQSGSHGDTARKDPDFRVSYEICQAKARKMPQTREQSKKLFYVNDPMVILINK